MDLHFFLGLLWLWQAICYIKTIDKIKDQLF